MASQEQLARIYAKKYADSTPESYLGGTAGYPSYTPVATMPNKKQGFTDKVGAIASQAAGIGGNLLKESAKFVVNTPKYVYEDIHKLGTGLGTALSGGYNKELDSLSNERKTLDQASAKYSQLYKSGKITRDNYKQLLHGLSEQYEDIRKRTENISSRIDKSKQEVVEGALMTAADVLSAGKLRIGATVGTNVGKQVAGRTAIRAVLDQSATKLERAALQIPSLRASLIRTIEKEGQKLAGESMSQAIKRNSRDLAIGYLLKRPVLYQTNIEQAKEGLHAVMEGDFPTAAKDAAWLGVQMLEGGPLGAAARGYSWLKGTTKDLSIGRGSFIDELSSRIGNGNRTQLARLVNTAYKQSDEAGKRVEEALRVSQEVSRRVYGNNITGAVDNFMQTYAGVDTSKLSAADIVRDLLNWRDADNIAQDGLKQLVNKGIMEADEAARYTPVRWDAATRDAVATAIEKAGLNPDDQWAAVERLAEQPGVGFGNNQRLMDTIRQLITKNAGTTGDVGNAVREIDSALASATKVPKAIQTKLNRLGYVLASPEGGRAVEHLELDDTARLISAAKSGRLNVFDPEIVPQPQVKAIANLLRVSGLSPEAASKEGSKKLAESFVENLDNTSVGPMFRYSTKGGDAVSGGQAIMTRLQDYIENKAPSTIGRIATLGHVDKSAIVDMRQLTASEIREALRSKNFSITNKMAKEVQKAITQAYIDVPMELRGLGDRAVDYLYKINPLQKYYSRAQSALRYTYNPFFRLQEGVETSLLSGAGGGNRITAYAKTSPHLWGQTRGQLDDAVKQLEDAQIFSSSLYGEAAQDQVLGRITANITQGQKRDLAGLALDIAKKQGIELAELAAEHPEQLDDALRVVVQYGRKGVLASPLARTLNVAFFPMRYNAKVTMLAAKVLAKQSPSVQMATLHSLLQFGDWLKSDEGIQWQSQYADAIQLFNWITPINSVESTLQLLMGHINAPGDLGQLGGLPIGVISQILDAEGIIKLNTPYVNPKTGDVFPDYIPESLKAKANVALSSLLGSVFTYPGRIVGLPGKEASIRDLINSIPGLGAKGSEFEKRGYVTTDGKGHIELTALGEERLTDLEKNMIRVLAGDTSKEAVDALYSSPAPGQVGYTLPPYGIIPLLTPLPKLEERTGLQTSKKSGKKKKKTAIPVTSR